MDQDQGAAQIPHDCLVENQEEKDIWFILGG